MAHYEKLVKQFGGIAVTLLIFIFGAGLAQAAAAPPLSIKSAAYNKKTSSLVIKTRNKGPGGLLTLLHSKGGVLGQTKKAEETFTIPLKELGEIPCQVEARLGELKISKAVAGAGAECSKVPLCKILKPANNIKTNINLPTHFEAQFALKDKKAGPLAVEWDFAGGVLGHPYEKKLKANKPILSGKHRTEATFVRDNSRYHVRFMATDTQGRHCESGIYIDVGTPPTDLPDITPLAQAAQESAPKRASGLQGDNVVLPFEKRSMQCGHEAELMPAGPPTVYTPQYNTINAYVYQKGLRPALLGDDRVELSYTAASNPADPVGANAINSTSQSWPLGEPNVTASLKKGELWEHYQRPPGTPLGHHYVSRGMIDAMNNYAGSEGQRRADPDEGAFSPTQTNPDHGSYMPGKTSPYIDNTQEAFNEFNLVNNWFSANYLPLTDIDDSGRVNPTSLFRVQAVDKESQTAVASTDVSVTSGKDFHCRECHAEGQIGAKTNVQRLNSVGATSFSLLASASDRIEDQEYAALVNMDILHWFYDFPFNTPPDIHPDKDQLVHADTPDMGCISGACHGGQTTSQPDQNTFGGGQHSRTENGGASNAMHRLHGALQYNADKSDILRDANGRYFCAGPHNITECNLDPNKSLFPVRAADGKILPMEQNCLKCHSGQREQCYRDRMYTAGVTCYQCHGDMMAVSQLYEKRQRHADGNAYRLPWLDQPDCGSCHVGSGNVGKTGKNGFYSAGIKTLAFAEDDPAATPNSVDLTNPDESRFAVVPLAELSGISYSGSEYNSTLNTPLFRLGKDNHGAVACPACHGPAHGIWPNRDPGANDNVTSLELQGHTGTLLECNVCHTADSFAKFADLDEGIRAADPKEGVLGGPHNMHPVNDPNWWQGSALDDTPNESSGKVKGGWHNDYAKIAGRTGEDQCAACHGNDHKGTRLSKTPVDREFVTAKDKKIKVVAGTPIGCDLCHTIVNSCTGSPAGAACGKPSEKTTASPIHKPVITSSPNTTVVFGEDYHHTVTANDPDGHTLSFRSDTVTIDANTGEVTVPSYEVTGKAVDRLHPSNANIANMTSLLAFDYYVTVSNDQGAQAEQLVRVNASCPSGQVMDMVSLSCTVVTITSSSPISGISEGDHYRYSVQATQRNGKQALTYSLQNQPGGMTIDATGLIQWVPQASQAGSVSFTIIVTGQGGAFAQQQVDMTVCGLPSRWTTSTDPWGNTSGQCVGPVAITSEPDTNMLSVSAGENYHYLVTATHRDHLPLNFSLTAAPDGMTITKVDATSASIDWAAQATTQGPVNFTVKADDGKGGTAEKSWNFNVCLPPMVGGQYFCQSPIEFTSWPPNIGALIAGDTYSFQATATHRKGLPISFILTNPPAGMTIDPVSGKIDWVVANNPDGYVAVTINAVDNATPQASAILPFSYLICDAGMHWDNDYGICQGPVVIEPITVFGTDAGTAFTYQVVANAPDGGPVSYSLADQPAGMTIDQKGIITWQAVVVDPANGNYFSYTVIATDAKGLRTTQFNYGIICEAPTHWNNDAGICE